MKLKGLSLFLVIAVFFSANGHLVVLQLVAWGTMAKQFHSETESIESALDKTFGGDFPCPICHSIADSMEAKDLENKGDKTAGFLQKSPSYLIPFFPPTFSYVRGKGNLFSEEVLLITEPISLIGFPPPRV